MKAYSTREVAELLGLDIARVRALMRSGVVTPQRDDAGHAAFSFQDLVLLRTAKGLIDAKVPARRITKALQALASQLPTDRPLSAVRVQIDGDRVIVRDSASSWEPESGQTVLDFSIREVLNKTALRRMAVLRPLKVMIENYEGPGEELEAINHPDHPAAGTRRISFGREIFIEQEDFMENPPKKFFRLSPGTEVRLRYAYFITCREVVKDAGGNVIELRCSYDPATKGGNAPDGRKVKATIHWVSATESVAAEVRLYNPLFVKPEPDVANFAADLNPDSLQVLSARFEPAIAADNSPGPVQFERQGYFARDPDSSPAKPVFNRTVVLRDSYAKVAGAEKP